MFYYKQVSLEIMLNIQEQYIIYIEILAPINTLIGEFHIFAPKGLRWQAFVKHELKGVLKF